MHTVRGKVVSPGEKAGLYDFKDSATELQQKYSIAAVFLTICSCCNGTAFSADVHRDLCRLQEVDPIKYDSAADLSSY